MCYCYNCKKYYHRLGIMSHRAVHRRKRENCKIKYSHGNVVTHMFGDPGKKEEFVPFGKKEKK